jgi:fructoselysine-6-P-deglycase FrlB-like protein
MAVQAFEASLRPPAAGLVIGVSHEGGTAATNAALVAARAAGRQIAVITVTGRSPAGSIADIVVETSELDMGWCHVIGYLSPIVAAAAVGAHVSGRSLDGDAVAGLLASGTRDTTGAERIAAGLAEATRIIVIASGADRSAGRELVLKIEEGSWVPSAYRDLETFLHGHLPAVGGSTAVVLLLADREGRAERVTRGRQALAAARAVGARTAAIVTATGASELDAELTLGRITVDEAADLQSPVAASSPRSRRSSSSRNGWRGRVARTPTRSAATTRSTGPRRTPPSIRPGQIFTKGLIGAVRRMTPLPSHGYASPVSAIRTLQRASSCNRTHGHTGWMADQSPGASLAKRSSAGGRGR